ncbi:MAG: hypothetical protein WC429_17260, partial [Verrucomicrobiia bacterium]
MRHTNTAKTVKTPQLEIMTSRATAGGLALLVTLACFMIVVVSTWAALPGVARFQNLNTVFGSPLWQSDSLWTDNERDVGKRLGWPEESRTTTLASYRLYAKEDARVLGARPYSLTLYAEKGRVTQ